MNNRISCNELYKQAARDIRLSSKRLLSYSGQNLKTRNSVKSHLPQYRKQTSMSPGLIIQSCSSNQSKSFFLSDRKENQKESRLKKPIFDLLKLRYFGMGGIKGSRIKIGQRSVSGCYFNEKIRKVRLNAVIPKVKLFNID